MPKRTLVLLVLALAVPCAFSAAIYRHVDAQGHVTYTDQPPDGAEEVQLAPTNTLPAARPGDRKAPAPAKPAKDQGYTALVINGVESGTTLNNPQGAITINVMATPGLRPGDRIVIRHNGREVGSDGIYQIEHIDRGEHVFEAEIVDADGRVLIKAPAQAITVQRPSALSPGRRKD